MEFDIKELIFVIVTLASCIGAFEVLRSRVKKVEDTAGRAANALFFEDGGLKMINNAACIEHRKQVKIDIAVVQSDVNRQAKNTQRAFDEIKCLNQNIIKLMIHWKVEPVVYKREKDE